MESADCILKIVVIIVYREGVIMTRAEVFLEGRYQIEKEIGTRTKGMTLSKEDGQLYYKLWGMLLDFVNRTYGINKKLKNIAEGKIWIQQK